MFESLIPIINTAIGGVLSLFGKNAEQAKAQTELQTAQQAVLVEIQRSKQAGFAVDIEKIRLLEAREVTAQKNLEEQTKIAKSKANIGLFTIGAVLTFLFGIGYLFVKFIIPVLYPKPVQNVVLQDE